MRQTARSAAAHINGERAGLHRAATWAAMVLIASVVFGTLSYHPF